MSNNIHSLNDYSQNSGSGIRSSLSSSNKDDRIFNSSIYKIRTVTFFIMIINISIYFFQLFLFYSIFEKKGNSWTCLAVTLGAFQGGKIKNNYQYHRFITSMFLHNSMTHLGSNSLSLFFLGFQVEHEINNKFYFFCLYFISGLAGNFLSLLKNQENISLGASGAIIGLCGNFVIYFLLNYRNMSERKKYSYGTMFAFLFINLFSGLSEGGENINMASHIGGFLGGLAFSIILTLKLSKKYKINNNSFALKLYYGSIALLIALPILTIVVVAIKKVPNIYVCKV